jgi:hypothetical protein
VHLEDVLVSHATSDDSGGGSASTRTARARACLHVGM